MTRLTSRDLHLVWSPSGSVCLQLRWTDSSRRSPTVMCDTTLAISHLSHLPKCKVMKCWGERHIWISLHQTVNAFGGGHSWFTFAIDFTHTKCFDPAPNARADKRHRIRRYNVGRYNVRDFSNWNALTSEQLASGVYNRSNTLNTIGAVLV